MRMISIIFLPATMIYPVGSEYIRYAYEDAAALLKGELTGTPMPAMGTIKMYIRESMFHFWLINRHKLICG